MESQLNEKPPVNNKDNYLFFMMEGTLFFIAISFITNDGIIPLFIYTYTGSLTLVGVVATVRTLSLIIPKILLAYRVNRIHNMPWFTAKVMFFTRPLILLMIPVLLFAESQMLVVWLFLLIQALLWSGHSIVSITWNDVFGRTVAPEKRGKVHGYQQLFGGIAGLVSGYIVKRLLDSPGLTDNQSYMLIFGFCGIFMLLSGLMLLPVKDGPRPESGPPRTMISYLKGLTVHLEGNRNFKQVTFVSFLSKVMLLANPFILLTAKNILYLPDDYVTTLIYIQITGGLVGGYLWGNISHRLGNRWVILLSNLLIMTGAMSACISILMGPGGLSTGLITFSVFMGGVNTPSWLGYLNYTLDISDEDNRIDLMILQSIIMLPMAFGGYLMGLTADNFGYLTVFVIVVIVSVASIGPSISLKSPSRHGQLSVNEE